MRNLLRRFAKMLRQDETGATLAEFAISCIILLTAIVVVAETCFAMYAYHFVSYSAQQAARYAIVHGDRWGSTTCASASTYDCNATAANIQSYVQGLAPSGMNGSAVTVTTTWPGTTLSGSTTGCSTPNSDGCLVQITVSYPFGVNFPLLPTETLQFTAHSQMVIEQ